MDRDRLSDDRAGAKRVAFVKLLDNLQRTVQALRSESVLWAICGGIAACLYRETPRYTGDIDIALTCDDPEKHNLIDIACRVAESLNYKPLHAYFKTPSGALSQQVGMIAGREDIQGGFVGIDLLLPILPWIDPAVRRAQGNQLDYGFGLAPTIYPEDLIVAKLFALRDAPERIDDLTDILSILKTFKALDCGLIRSEIQNHHLPVPPPIHSLLYSQV